MPRIFKHDTMKKTARNIILFDDNEIRKHLMPFTYTRPTAMLRLGITTISEKWQASRCMCAAPPTSWSPAT